MLVFDHDPAALAPSAIAVAVLGAPILLLLGRVVPRLVVDIVAIVFAAATLALLCAVFAAATSGRVVDWAAGWAPHHGDSVGIVLVADPVGAAIAMSAAFLMVLALLYSAGHIDSVHGHFHCLMLLFLGGMVGLALSGDIFDMFGFFELMGAATYGLTGIKVEEEASLQGALNFGIVNSLGAYVTLMGIGLLFARTGRLDLPGLGLDLQGHPPDALVICAFCLVVTGFLVKAAVVPFHFWLADAHAVAPSPVCLLFSGAMVPLGVYATFRIYWVVFGGTIPVDDVRRTFLFLGVLTAVVGALMALTQRHVKRMLAYTTIAHGGLFVVALGCMDAAGTAGAFLYVAGFAGVVGALFLLTGILSDLYETVDEHKLHGLARRRRVLGALFVMGALGLAALPPFGTALGSAVSESAAASLGYAWAPVLFVGVAACTGAAALRAGGRAFFGLGPDLSPDERDHGYGARDKADRDELDAPLDRIPWSMLAPAVVLLLAAIVVGVLPGARILADRAGALFVDRAGYVSQALYRARVHLVAHDVATWSLGGVGAGLVSVAAAVAAACASWFGRSLADRVPQLRRAAGLVRALHRLHSGHVGDYVAWLFVGIVVLAGFVGLPVR
ncbi:MAG: complex I subunit 5 family protein [Acidimicrobiales bacterium]